MLPPVGCETTNSVGERPHTYALEHAATGIGENYGLMERNRVKTLFQMCAAQIYNGVTSHLTMKKICQTSGVK